MIIELKNIAKRYGIHWVIKEASFKFQDHNMYGISGPNGSGKSTLIQMVSGYLSPSLGSIHYEHNGSRINRDLIRKYISISAPYIDVIEDLNIKELFQLCKRFEAIPKEINFHNFLEISDLETHQNKIVKNLSSGLKQRLKISLDLCSQAPILIMDEPTSYFDRKTKNWFYEHLQRLKKKQLVILASNDEDDLTFCDEIVDVQSFK